MADEGIKETGDRWAQMIVENLAAGNALSKEEIDAIDEESFQRSFHAEPLEIGDKVEIEAEPTEESRPEKKKLTPPKLRPKN